MTVQTVVNWARTHIRLAPIVNVGGFTNEPALAIAHDVKLHIISQEYNWKWNRATKSFDTVEDQFDYTHASLSLTDVGWLERAYIEDKVSTAVPKPRFPLEVVGQLQVPMYKNTPEQVADELNAAGGKVIRLNTLPTNIIYTVNLDYQKTVTAPANLSSVFDPIPGDMDDVIRQFFLAYALRLRNDQSYLIEMARGEEMLKQKMGVQDQPNDINIGFAPERPILWG